MHIMLLDGIKVIMGGYIKNWKYIKAHKQKLNTIKTCSLKLGVCLKKKSGIIYPKTFRNKCMPKLYLMISCVH